MTMNLLKQIAGSRLPDSFSRTEDIDQVRLLRAAGLVTALVPAPSEPVSLSGSPSAAQVLAVTEKGREELAQLGFPVSGPHRWRSLMPRIKALAHASSRGRASRERS